MPARARRRSDGGRSTFSGQRPETRPIPVLEKAARSVESAVERGRVTATTRMTFQAVALLVRELRARVTADDLSDAQRNARLKPINAIATGLARTAARDSSLLALLADDTAPPDRTNPVLSELRLAAGMEAPAEVTEAVSEAESERSERIERRVVPQSVISRQLANPFLAPDFSEPPPPRPQTRRLSSWSCSARCCARSRRPRVGRSRR